MNFPLLVKKTRLLIKKMNLLTNKRPFLIKKIGGFIDLWGRITEVLLCL